VPSTCKIVSGRVIHKKISTYNLFKAKYTGCLKNGAQSLECITYSKSRVKFRCQFFCPLASFQVIQSLK
jgi:hypothetical protein